MVAVAQNHTPRDFPSSLQNAHPLAAHRVSGLRYYSPEMGRWVNRDPIHETGNISLYSFALNEPIASIDALGRMARRPRCPPERGAPPLEEGCDPGDTRTIIHPPEVHGGEYTGASRAYTTLISEEPLRIRVRCFCERENYEIHIVEEHQKCVEGVVVFQIGGTTECPICDFRDTTFWKYVDKDVQITEIPSGWTVEDETICSTTACVTQFTLKCTYICANAQP